MSSRLELPFNKNLFDVTLGYLDMSTQATVTRALADKDKLPQRVRYIADWHLCFLWGAARFAQFADGTHVADALRKPDVPFPDEEARAILSTSVNYYTIHYYKKVGLVDLATTFAAQAATQAQEKEDEDDVPIPLKKEEDLVTKSAEIIRRILQHPPLQQQVFSKVVRFEYHNRSGDPLPPAYVPDELGLYFPHVTFIDLKPSYDVWQKKYETFQGPVDLTPLSQLKYVDMRFSGVTREHLLLPHATYVDDDLCIRDSELVSSGTWYSVLYVWIWKVLKWLGNLCP